ncbi:MAG TPA: hypothetical protein VKD22_15105, partial [Ramlibacter sp.]|nr:hypothetical protein [Ramlibacter sp.]
MAETQRKIPAFSDGIIAPKEDAMAEHLMLANRAVKQGVPKYLAQMMGNADLQGLAQQAVDPIEFLQASASMLQ